MSCSPIRISIARSQRPRRCLRTGCRCLREAFEKMLADPNFVAEAKKLVDWDGSSYLSGAELQKKIETTVTQPPEVIKRIKEILKESG